MQSYSLNELAEIISAELVINQDAAQSCISGINSIDKAKAGELSFIVNQKYAAKLAQCSASALIVPPELAAETSVPLLICKDPYFAYAKISQLFEKRPKQTQGIHPSAVVADSAEVHSTACIGANAVISDKAKIGANTRVEAGAYIGEEVVIGENSYIQANVSIHYACEIGNQVLIQSGTVIGSDGFGYAPKKGGWEKIAQLGRVIIGNDVEIGANTCIDRGALQDTIIGDNVIIDNLVHIAHNVEIKKASAIAGCVGIAGGTVMGKGCTVGGQAGINGHIEIADNVHLSGMAMVTNSIKESGQYASGLPLMPQKDWRKTVVYVRQIERLNKRVKALEKQLEKEKKD